MLSLVHILGSSSCLHCEGNTCVSRDEGIFRLDCDQDFTSDCIQMQTIPLVYTLSYVYIYICIELQRSMNFNVEPHMFRISKNPSLSAVLSRQHLWPHQLVSHHHLVTIELALEAPKFILLCPLTPTLQLNNFS